jgi:hypothetical protein
MAAHGWHGDAASAATEIGPAGDLSHFEGRTDRWIVRSKNGKPFPQRLLVERVKAVLRRASPKDAAAPKEADGKVLERGHLRMDEERHSCTWKNEPVTLTVTEFLILRRVYDPTDGRRG